MSTERRYGLDTPTGPVTVTLRGDAVALLSWSEAPAPDPDDALGVEAVAQLAAYFDRRLTDFDLPLAPVFGFAARMRLAMQGIPYGLTRTYGEIARDLGVTAQAVGQGCGSNSLPVIVPCHRVLAANGLGGYSGRGGIETKVALLRREGAGGLLL